jgi:hypothetical protein
LPGRRSLLARLASIGCAEGLASVQVMQRHEFLGKMHELLQPRSYLEVGIDQGLGVSQSRTRTIGVDPAYAITAEVACELQLVRATSDAFFARESPVSWFPDGVIDLAFLDGLHLFEFALRDFMNVEAFSSARTVVFLDDMLPRSPVEATRNRQTVDWTGDVFRLSMALREYRPDLAVLQIDTEPTGLLLVLGLDRQNTTLDDHYAEILDQYVRPDPQEVPEDVLTRSAAAHPDLVLASPLWGSLAEARDQIVDRERSVEMVKELSGSARYTPRPYDPVPFPPPPLPLGRRVAAALSRRASARAGRFRRHTK